MDDWVTRGSLSAPFIKTGKSLTTDLGYNSRIIGKWQADLGAHTETRDRLAFTERSTQLSTGIRYFPSDNLRFFCGYLIGKPIIGLSGGVTITTPLIDQRTPQLS